MKSSLLFIYCAIISALPLHAQTTDNAELIQMVKEDQLRRNTDSNEPMEPKDKVARLRVMEMIAGGLVKTAEDKLNAALILQHTALHFCNGQLVSFNPENYYLAYTLSKSAFDSGYKQAANFVATTYDRFLLYTEGYQKYGTQMVNGDNDEEVWAPIDPATTDEERKKYRVKPLAELLKQAKMKPFPSKK